MTTLTETAMEYHPGANLLPMTHDDELLRLAYDIRLNGQKEPIVCDWSKRLIIDGRARYMACGMIGVRPLFRELHGYSSPTIYALRLNLPRHTLTRGQRAALALDARDLVRAELQDIPQDKRSADCRDNPPGDQVGFRALATHTLGSSRHDFEVARRTRMVSPERFALLRSGELSYEQARDYLKTLSLKDAPWRTDASRRRLEQIQQLAREGHCAEQVAEQLQMNAHYVQEIATKAGIIMPLNKTPKLDVNRVISQTVDAAQMALVGIELLDKRTADIDLMRINDWVASLKLTIRGLRDLINKLQPRSNDNGENEGHSRKVRQATGADQSGVEIRTTEPDASDIIRAAGAKKITGR